MQLYVAPPENGLVSRPVRELKGFDKLELKPGEVKTARFKLDKRSFAYYETDIQDWKVEKGTYKIQICRSAEEVVLEESIQVYPQQEPFQEFDLTTPVGMILKDPVGKQILGHLFAAGKNGAQENDGSKNADSARKMLSAMTEQLPLRGLLSFRDMGIGHGQLQELVDEINRKRKDDLNI